MDPIILQQDVAPTVNGSSNAILELIDGWLIGVQVFVVNQGLTGPALRAPGVFYAVVALLPSSDPKRSGLVWAGGVHGGSRMSIPNVRVQEGMQVQLVTYTGSALPGADDRLQVVAMVSQKAPVGGASIFNEAPFTGPGNIRVVALGDPAAAAQYALQTVPAQVRWELVGFGGALVKDATAGNRIFYCEVDDGTNVVKGTYSNPMSIVSITVNNRAARGGHLGGQDAANMGLAIGLPQGQIPPGHRVGFGHRGITAGDNWGAGQMKVEEWAGPSAA